ncbi:MAG TPA: heme exporter protein CcmD [Scandinavium sp.]|jgi:heme exporter protein D
MNSAFDSVPAFFEMGGYAFYVWIAVAFTLIPLTLLLGYTFWHRRAVLADIRRQQARERRMAVAKNKTVNVGEGQ